jgi:type I restriction enzyme S subunit
MSTDKNKLIPELRFPEFVKDGEWVAKSLGRICDVRDGTHDSPKYIPDGFPLITSKNLLENGEMDFDNVNFLSREDYDKINQRSKVDVDDILFGMIGTIGNPVIVKREGFAIKNVALIKSKGELNQGFLIQLMKSEYIAQQFQKANAGGILKFIALGMIRKLHIPTPSPQEQQKIASCLSSLDEVIAANSQKLATLKDHKKGLMQNLFPTNSITNDELEITNVPNYRFPEFLEDGDWVEKKLNYYLELLTDFEANGSFADVKANVTVYDKPNFAWYVRATDLEKKSDLESVKYVDEHSYNFLNKTKLLGGELLITKRGEIGKVYIYLPFKNLPATVAPNMYLLKINEKAIPNFFYYHFTNNKGNQSLKSLNASSTIGALYKNDVKNISVCLPSLCEQQKIASCLSSLDDLITAQTEKIAQLKLHKKGLMQGLFPGSITN